ncbi:MAG: twin-arginine translocase subunit TatC [Anaerolineae bacterium]|jgi:sec-independent protein translocase protein TatC
MSEAQATANGVPEGEPGTMPLMEHLVELRNRLIRVFIALFITTGISFVFAKQVFLILMVPLGDARLQALRPTETLGNYMKVSLLSGLVLSMPVIVYQIGRFLLPGLTKQERKYLLFLVPGATICFLTGVAFAYFVMLPASIGFLQTFMADLIEQQWTVGDYLSFVTSLLFWIGVAFELPLFVYFLAKAGVIDAEALSRNRKYALIGIAVLAAVITPTVDPLNMALVMGPLIVLYELGVLLAKIA